MFALIVTVEVGTIVWMGFDAYHAGRSWSSILGWVLGALFVWIVAFPWYLVNRRTFEKVNADWFSTQTGDRNGS